jgi:hypothetical protein
MRLSFLSFGLLALGAIANPVKEDSSTTVEVAEKVACDGSHFIVSVQRYCPLLSKLTLVEQTMSDKIQEN